MQNHSAPRSTLPGYFSPLPPPPMPEISPSQITTSLSRTQAGALGHLFQLPLQVQGLGWKGRLIFTDVNREDLIKENFWLAFYI